VNAITLHEEMLSLISELEMLSFEMVQQARTWAEAERDYRKGRARAILTAEGSVAVKEAIADEQCNELMFEAHLAEATMKATKEAVRAKQAAISGLQTIASSYKSEADFARTGPR